LGLLLANEGKLADALAHLQEATFIWPGFAEAYSNLANVLSWAGRSEEARLYFERAIRLKPNYATARHDAERHT
jgi:Flp pilus assembly protein TadD